ncbi:MAG TPA: tetratricopeptide repeat protein, partial [Candidatus Ozemobacteraceae bacterium]|nr:tetratricopeptide repeat protein [Candidatus Ozemobacteraceae bacterium]
AEAGSAAAMKAMADRFEDGIGCEQNPKTAHAWLEKAAAAGDTAAATKVSERNAQLTNLRERAAKGNGFARYELWRLENHIPEDVSRQEQLLLPAAEKGDQNSADLLCLLYVRELEVGTPEARRTWLNKFAAKGDANVKFLIAKQFQTGIGLPRDFERAAELYRQSRDLGHPNAARELQELYDAGQADAQEDSGLAQTLDGLKQKAESGDAASQLKMAIKLAKGEGTAIDMPAAITWIRKAAAQNYPRAMTSLGQLHLGGQEGVKEDPTEGVRLLKQAAEAGDAEAVVTLMKWHQSKKPGADGDIEALAWAYVLIKRSETLGDIAWAYRDAGNFHVEKLTGSLSTGEIQKARKRQNELLKTISAFKRFDDN